MKELCLFTCVASFAVFALPPVLPVLPPVEHLDTETVTNMLFTAWQCNLRDFTVNLSFVATPSNNVEMAFGVDADDDGLLSPGESDLVVGWDCGSWFVEDGETGERFTAAPTGGCGQHDLALRVRLRRDGAIESVRFLDNGSEAFAEIAATKPAWFHAPTWTRMRLVGRGENVRAGERFSAQVTPQGTSMRLR